MVLTSTGAAGAIGKVIPELDGKLTGDCIRVPTPNVSLVDLFVNVSQPTTIEEINEAIKQRSDKDLMGIMGYTDESNPLSPRVSSDFIHGPYSTLSSVFILSQTQVYNNGTQASVRAWYNNEKAFSHRMVDTALKMHDIRYD